MYPESLKSHLHATLAATWAFAFPLGIWIGTRSGQASFLECFAVFLVGPILMGVVFSRIDAKFLPKSD